MVSQKNTLYLILTIIFLSACATQTQVATMDSDLLAREFRYLPQGKKSDLNQWYQQLNDPVLNDLITIGIKKNFNIIAATKRVEAANAYAKTVKADLLPTVGVSGNLGYQDTTINNKSNNIPIPLPTIPSKISIDDNLAMLGFSASWEPDIFGKKNGGRR